MADLEHDIPINADTIFEAGSVAKQFTAAAVLLLAADGRLSLDDPARTYIPELPDYGAALTIRHMLTHTSGLRDWGSVAAIGGWPRSTRAYTHSHVLDIVGRQKSLNFTPGTKWSYSNTGYNLAAIIVSRVSGMPFAEFTRRRMFEPLGMTRTSWRDDYTRVVKDRAIAYSEQNGRFHMLMPFENVHGNGGLLTTVRDLITWTGNFTSHTIGNADFVRQQQEAGRFSDGRQHRYALGLRIGAEQGQPTIAHGGATAGYRAHLLHYPARRTTVAVLCNAASAAAEQHASAVAAAFIPAAVRNENGDATAVRRLPSEDGAVYRNVTTGALLRSAAALSWTQDGGSLKLTDVDGNDDRFERVPRVSPTPEQLTQFAGTYVSDEAEATLVAAVEANSLVLKRRPDVVIRLTPEYADAFTAPGLGLIIFRRDRSGAVSALSVNQDRVWDLRFTRQSLNRPSQ
jgi:CubicO group peptidase (beta-lactamase class C family)